MQAERIARLLPEVYQRTIVAGTPIATLLEVMAQLQDPVEEVLAQLPDYFDPQLTPDRFVPFLARWVDLARWLDDTSGGFDSGVGRLRQVVAGAAHLSRIRGTAQGLRDALEWATGVSGVRIDEEVPDAAGRIRPFHVVVRLPKEAVVHQMLVQRIVQQEKPAHVTAEVVFENGPETSPPEPVPEEAPVAPTLPVGGPAAPPEPSFPGSEPAPVLTGAPEAEPPAGPEPESPTPAVVAPAATVDGDAPTVVIARPPAAAPGPAPATAPAPVPAPAPPPPEPEEPPA
ncbi:phage tail protein [Microbacterium pumilum]|uniref:Phage tail protein n=1 Tax=Microbacterium pumilum TaxID=344165 RepID=A0ABN2RU64_9MICO